MRCKMYHSFRPGQIWKDTAGKPIQAHGFSVFYNEKDETYYCMGRIRKRRKAACSILCGTGASAVIPQEIYITGRTGG